MDGGFATHGDIQEAAKKGVVVYAPLPEVRPVTKTPHGPPEPLPPAVIAWRERMQTEQAKAIYKQRASTVEWVNAMLCNRGTAPVCGARAGKGQSGCALVFLAA